MKMSNVKILPPEIVSKIAAGVYGGGASAHRSFISSPKAPSLFYHD